MRLELNGRVISERPDEAAIAQALAQMNEGGSTLALHRPPADFVQVEGTTSRGFTLNVYEDAQGTNFTSGSRKLDAGTVTAVMARFAAGSPEWRNALQQKKWQSGTKQLQKSQGVNDRPGMIGLIALAVFGIPFVTWAAISGMSGGSAPLTWDDTWKGLITIVFLSSFIAWVDIFFRTIRPKIAQWLGKRLRSNIQESREVYDMGMWDTKDGKPMGRVLIFFLDVAITIVGVVGPLALPAVILFVLFNK